MGDFSQWFNKHLLVGDLLTMIQYIIHIRLPIHIAVVQREKKRWSLLSGIKNLKYAKAIYLEVNVDELYKGCGLIGEIDDFLLQYNFKRVITHITQNGWGDALYVTPLDIENAHYVK